MTTRPTAVSRCNATAVGTRPTTSGRSPRPSSFPLLPPGNRPTSDGGGAVFGSWERPVDGRREIAGSGKNGHHRRQGCDTEDDDTNNETDDDTDSPQPDSEADEYRHRFPCRGGESTTGPNRHYRVPSMLRSGSVATAATRSALTFLV